MDLPNFDHVQTSPIRGGCWGGFGRDFLQGTGRADLMNGGFGDDVIVGGGGNDNIFGGLGNDRILGGEGHDFITGGLGDDWIEGASGTDTIYGGFGNDVLTGGAGDGDILTGDFGQDTDVFRRGDGADIVQGLNRREGDVVDLRDFAAVLGDIDGWDELSATFGMVESRRWGGDTMLHLTEMDLLTIRWTNADSRATKTSSSPEEAQRPATSSGRTSTGGLLPAAAYLSCSADTGVAAPGQWGRGALPARVVQPIRIPSLACVTNRFQFNVNEFASPLPLVSAVTFPPAERSAGP